MNAQMLVHNVILNWGHEKHCPREESPASWLMEAAVAHMLTKQSPLHPQPRVEKFADSSGPPLCQRLFRPT